MERSRDDRQKDLDVRIKNERKDLHDAEKESLSYLIERTRLAPFSECLGPDPNEEDSEISQLLEDKENVRLARFTDQEVSALVAVAHVWAERNNTEKSFKLCMCVRDKFWREDFGVIDRLIQLTGELMKRKDQNEIPDGPFRQSVQSKDWREENLDYIQTAADAIKRAQDEDPTSSYWKSSSRQSKVRRLSNIVRKHFKDGVEEFDPESHYRHYREAIEDLVTHGSNDRDLEVIPEFHYTLGCIHENYGRKFGQGQPAKDEHFKALKELEKACELAPENTKYSQRWSNLWQEWSNRWSVTHGIADKLKKSLPSPIEIEIASKTIADLGFKEGQLPEALKENVELVRTRLKYEMGFTLPGVLFRDDSRLDKGEYRFRIRGVPLAVERLPESSYQEEQLAQTKELRLASQFDALAQQIENCARKFAAQFYGLQDRLNRIRATLNQETGRTSVASDSAVNT